ncbi:MAG: FAD-dependent oxidoreductase, partial [Phenylobacterium sp.]|nr:FAD-dependent oxidoreductase [Phenylobacterium sp.]
MDFDLVVIGAGPGGYVAAIRAAQLGLKTAIVERDKLGGICLNWGCIPTKALLKSAETFETLGHLEDYGLRAQKVGFDLDAVVARSRKVAGQLNAGVAFLMKKNKITVIEGEARLEAGAPAPLVRVALKAGGEQVLKAANVLLATGARARTLPDLGLAPDGERVWSYREAMVPDRVPTSLLVVGSGAIGIEFASFFRALGSEVTVVEALPRILPVEDEEVSAAAQKAFQARGVAFRTGASVRRLARSGKGVELT